MIKIRIYHGNESSSTDSIFSAQVANGLITAVYLDVIGYFNPFRLIFIRSSIQFEMVSLM